MAKRYNIIATKVAQFNGHKDAIYDFVIDKKRNMVYTAGADGYVVEWDILNSENGSLVLQCPEALYAIDYADDKLFVGSRSGTQYVVNLKSKKLEESFKLHNGGVFFNNEIWSGGEDGILTITEGKTKRKIGVSDKSLRCILENADSFYVGCSDNTIYEINKRDNVVSNRLIGHSNTVFALELVNGNMMLSAGRDGKIIAWDLTINRPVHNVSAHLYQIKSLSYNNQFLISSSMDKTIKVWTEDLDLQKVIDFEGNKGHTNCINKVEWLDENMFVSCSDDRSLILWQVKINS